MRRLILALFLVIALAGCTPDIECKRWSVVPKLVFVGKSLITVNSAQCDEWFVREK